MARNGRSGEEVDEEEHVFFVGVRRNAVDDTVATVDAVLFKRAAMGRGKQ